VGGVRDELGAVGSHHQDACVAAVSDLVAFDAVAVGPIQDLDPAVAVVRHGVPEHQVPAGTLEADAQVAASGNVVAIERVGIRIPDDQAPPPAGRDEVIHDARVRRSAHESDPISVVMHGVRTDHAAVGVEEPDAR
jgi:hypothetical protein